MVEKVELVARFLQKLLIRSAWWKKTRKNHHQATIWKISMVNVVHHPHHIGKIWKCSSFSTVRPPVHSNPSQNALQTGEMFSENASFGFYFGQKKVTKTELFENDDITIIIDMRFPVSSFFFPNTNPNWPVIVGFLNFSRIAWSTLFPRGRVPFGQYQESRPLRRSDTGSPRFTDFPLLCACSEWSLANLTGRGRNECAAHARKIGPG